MPTLVLVATDSAGKPLNDVWVDIDDARVVDRLDERPVEVDAGEHRLRFGRSGGVVVERVVRAEPGTKNTRVVATFPNEASRADSGKPPHAATSARAPTVVDASSAGGPPTSALVVGGLGIASLLAGAALGIAGHVKRADLSDSCAPACSSDRADSIRVMWWTGAIAAGAGAVALGAATWIAVGARPSAPRGARTVARVRAGHDGAALTLDAVF
jgi:hypothetical protein